MQYTKCGIEWQQREAAKKTEPTRAKEGGGGGTTHDYCWRKKMEMDGKREDTHKIIMLLF